MNGGLLQGRELTSKVYVGTKLMDRRGRGMMLGRPGYRHPSRIAASHITSRWAWLKLRNILLKLQTPILSMIQAFEWCIFVYVPEVNKAFRLLHFRGVQHINNSIPRLIYFH